MSEIKKSEISEKGLLDGFVKDAKKGLEAIEDFNKGLEESLRLQAELIKQGKKDTTSKGLKKQAELYEDVDENIKNINISNKAKIAIEKSIEKQRLAELKLQKDREKAFDRFEKEQQKNAKAELKRAEDTRKAGVKSAKDKEKALADLEKQRLKNISTAEKQRLAELKLASDRKKAFDKADQQIEKEAAAAKKLKKQRLELNDAYTKESKELNDLRKRYKSLAVQNKENTDEGKKLLKNITRLDKKLKDIDDTVGQNTRTVGKYEKALDGLNKTIGKIGAIAIIAKSFEFLGEVFGTSREGALALQIALSKITVRAKVFVNNLINAGEGIKEFFVAVHESFLTLDANIEKSAKKIQLAFLKILDKNPLADYTEEIATVNKEIGVLDDTLDELSKSSVSDAIDKVTGAFKDTGETVDRATEAQEKYLELQLKTRIEIEQQEKALAGLAEKRQILQDISDDDTLGFITRAKAVERAKEAEIEFAELENKLALTKEKLTIEAIKQDLREANALSERRLEQIKTGEQLQKILQDAELARKVSDTNDEAFTAAFVERREKQVESESFRRDAEEKFRKTARDDFEQELDILEEFTEKKVASNEKIINSDSASLKARQKALRDNQKLEQELLDASIALIIEQGKASIDLREDLTEAEKEHQKSLLNTAAIPSIVNEQDEQEIFNLIRKLDLGEIEEKRLKEALKIKQDIAEVNRESLKVEQEAAQKTKELQEEILLQERVLAGEKIDLDKEGLENEKDNLEDRIEVLKSDSVERLGLQVELNDLLIDEEERKNDAIIASENKLQKKRLEIFDARIQAAQNIAGIFESSSDRRIKAINAEFEAEKITQEQRDARLAKEENRQKAIENLQKALAITEILTNLSREVSAIREKNAKKENSKALNRSQILQARTSAALGVANVLSAYDGVDDTGGRGNIDSKGGKTWTLHPNEQVHSLKDRQSMSDPSTGKLRTRDEIKERVNFADSLMMSPHAFKQIEVGRTVNSNDIDLKGLITAQKSSTKEITKAIRDNASSEAYGLNSLGELVYTFEKKGQKNNYTIKRRRI